MAGLQTKFNHFLKFKMVNYADKCCTDYHAFFIRHEAGAVDSGVSHGTLTVIAVVVMDKKRWWCGQNWAIGSHPLLLLFQMIIGWLIENCLYESGKHCSHEKNLALLTPSLCFSMFFKPHNFLKTSNNLYLQCYLLLVNYYYIYMHVCLCIKSTTNFVWTSQMPVWVTQMVFAVPFSSDIPRIPDTSHPPLESSKYLSICRGMLEHNRWIIYIFHMYIQYLSYAKPLCWLIFIICFISFIVK